MRLRPYPICPLEQSTCAGGKREKCLNFCAIWKREREGCRDREYQISPQHGFRLMAGLSEKVILRRKTQVSFFFEKGAFFSNVLQESEGIRAVGLDKKRIREKDGKSKRGHKSTKDPTFFKVRTPTKKVCPVQTTTTFDFHTADKKWGKGRTRVFRNSTKSSV